MSEEDRTLIEVQDEYIAHVQAAQTTMGDFIREQAIQNQHLRRQVKELQDRGTEMFNERVALKAKIARLKEANAAGWAIAQARGGALNTLGGALDSVTDQEIDAAVKDYGDTCTGDMDHEHTNGLTGVLRLFVQRRSER